MKTLVLIAALAVAPAAALAQDVPGGAGGSNASAQMRNDAWAAQEQLGQNLRAQGMEQQQDQYRDTQNPRRVRRAQEAADLINKGDCAGARAVAARANDDRLAARIAQVCSAAAVPAPATAPSGQ